MDAWQYILVYYISISIPSVIITVYDKIAAIKKSRENSRKDSYDFCRPRRSCRNVCNYEGNKA
ncbi:MAG: hypothetical protein ACLRXK_04725 [Acutalibacteraceae bacterium]